MLRDPRSAPLLLVSALLLLASLFQVDFAAAGAYCPEIVGTIAKEVASADFNHDGFADFAVTTEPNAVAIVFGQAGPRPTSFFGTIPTGGTVRDIAAGDLNGDGNADIVVTQPVAGAIRVMLGRGDGTFSFSDPIAAGSNPFRLSVGDLDGDGDLDVATLSGLATLDPKELSIFLNNGDGTFAPRLAFGIPGTVSSEDDLALGDIDGDGDDDAVVLVSDLVSGAIVKQYVIVRSNGDGTFASSTTAPEGVATSAIALGDVNHDGRADLVAKDGYLGIGGPGPRRLTTYYGRADGTFDPPIYAPTTVQAVDGRLALADLNGDGQLDAVMMAGPFFAGGGCDLGAVDVALGNGAAAFAEMPKLITGGSTTAIAISDATGDGILDLATTGNECGTLVLNPGNGDGTFRTVKNEARAFVDNNNDVIRLNANKSTWCLNYEPVGGTFDLATELRWIELRSPGTGTISVIGQGAKPIVITDGDHNGIPDARICFPKTQLRQLFSNLNGRQTVTVTLHTEIGAPTCNADAPLTIDVIPGGNGNNAAAFVRPDADGRRWTLSYRAESPSTARLRLYDVSGRLVRALSLPNAVAGWNDVPLDGRDDAGRALPSGVFFYRLEAGGEPIAGKFVVAR